jgi:hypothetical protein
MDALLLVERDALPPRQQLTVLLVVLPDIDLELIPEPARVP